MRILWANFYCLLDTSSGASISVAQILTELKKLGHEVKVLGATIFDAPKGISKFGEHWESVEKLEPEKFFNVNDGNLTHHLMKTRSTNRDSLTSSEMNAWFSRYQLELKYFKPGFIFFYGGGVAGFIPAEARAWNIPCGAYLVNESFHGYRWCRDIDTFITDTNATRDLYRRRLNINAFPIGKFIGNEKLAINKSPKRLLYINPALNKGAVIVIMMARLLLKLAPEIQIEIVESRGDWDSVLKAVNTTLGYPEDDCPENIIITANTSDMAAVYARARVLFVPSLWWESGARVIAEAQLNGIPVVASDRGGNLEMVGSGGVIFALPDSCYKAPYLTTPTVDGLKPIAEKIISLFKDDKLYGEKSLAALANASLTSNVKTNAKKLENHIISLVKAKKTWVNPSYVKPSYLPYEQGGRYGEELLYEPLLGNQKGIFIDCGGYDGCSSVKFIVNNPNFDCITFEPNPELWKYYENVPTTLVKKGVAATTEKRRFTLDEIDADGSLFVVGKAIDFTHKVKNEEFKSIDIECVDICEIIKSLKKYEKIILKLDVEGAEYEILEKLLDSGLISKVYKLYAEWHWHKIGMSQEDHLSIYNRVKENCDIFEWDALDMSVHNREEIRNDSRLELIASIIGNDIKKYQTLEFGRIN